MPDLHQDWVATRQLARELGVSVDVALSWKRHPSFPVGGTRRAGKHIFWHLPTIKSWRAQSLRRRTTIFQIR